MPARRPPGLTRPAAGPSRPRRRALVALLVVTGLLLAAGGCAGQGGQAAGSGAKPPAPGPAPGAPAPSLAGSGTAAPEPGAGSFDLPGTPPEAPGFEVGGLPKQPAVPGTASPPVRLAIPAIGVATPLLRLGLAPDGGLQVPADFGRAGWFTGGPAPGQAGPSVIAGHVDSRTGPAVFYRLRELRPGDAVLVERADGARLRFVVEQARSYPKAAFPTAAVFGPVPAAALRLVTCTGDFDRAHGSYRDNLVVFTRLAASTGAGAGKRG